MDNYIVGRNAVKEALRSGRSIQRIMVSEDKVKTGLADIVGLAKSQGIEVRPTPIKQMNKYDLAVPHQGVIALVSAVQFKELGEVLQETNHEVPLLILTDGVEDPHNMGASSVLRSVWVLRLFSFLSVTILLLMLQLLKHRLVLLNKFH